MIHKYRWYGALITALMVAGGGLVLGKFRERDYISALYQRTDFTLLDDAGNFFRLRDLPARKLALLVFTPDGIPTTTVLPFAEFTRHVEDLRAQGIEPFLVSRVNRDIVRNFKNAAGFRDPFLIDAGGTVSRNAGVWDGARPATYWAYALVDREFRVLWRATEAVPLSFEKLAAMLREAK